MFQDYAVRLAREPWGSQVSFDQEYVTSWIQAIVRTLESQGVQVQGGPDRDMRTPRAHGVDGLRDELSLMLGNPHPLTQRERLVVEKTLADGDSTGLVQINAYSNDPDGDPIALDIVGGLKLNGVRIVGIPIGGMIFWPGAAADIPDGWAIMDGTANSVANGGSGKNVLNAYVKMASTSGSAVVAAGNTGSTAETGTIGGSTGAATPAGTCSGTTDSGAASLSGSTATFDTSHTHDAGTLAATDAGHTHGAGSYAAASHTHGVGTLTDLGHAHGLALLANVPTDGASSAAGYNFGATDNGNASLSGSTASSAPSVSGTSSSGTASISMSGATASGGSDHSHGLGSIADAGHTHAFSGTIAVASHAHTGSSLTFTGGGHVHTAGEPAHFDFIPIEYIGA